MSTRRPVLRSLVTLRFVFAAGAIWIGTIAAEPIAAQEPHPLDPLTWEEHWTVLEVLRDASRLDDSTRFSQISLHEPPKAEVWAWKPGDAFSRSAFATVRQGERTFEATVDLRTRELASWRELEGIQPAWLLSEFDALSKVVKEHPDFVAAMERRGILDLTFVDCFGGPPGYFGIREREGRRIAHWGCQDARRVRNTWTRWIEGVVVVMDMNAGEVLEVIDEGVVPVPSTTAEYDEASMGPLREHATPIALSQPLGPSFELDGGLVTWDRWSFHLRPHPRVGVVVSTVRYRDGERDRPVLYQGHLSEIFVPYMDPGANWYARNFLDAGEYFVGGLGKPLEPGIDCPSSAAYMDLVVPRDNGRPRVVERALCLFERYGGDVAWRHRDETVEGRPQRDLVARIAAVLGNYDYLFDWRFQQDGTIRVAVGATGIAEAKAVAPSTAVAARAAASAEAGTDDGPSEPVAPADAYGRYVAKNIVAVNHDHYFSFRLDLDVDGTTNSFVQDRLVTRRLPDDHPRRSVWVVRPQTAATELEAVSNIDLRRPTLWRVVNPTRTNTVGYPVSYQLSPGTNLETLLAEDDYPRRRAGFIDHHLWVTPYRLEERFAAGMYPTLSRPGQGLPEWTSADRPIESTDLVLWYTTGMHHVVRAEDWPVMPVAWTSFELRPFDFFDGNPALDAPKKP